MLLLKRLVWTAFCGCPQHGRWDPLTFRQSVCQQSPCWDPKPDFCKGHFALSWWQKIQTLRMLPECDLDLWREERDSSCHEHGQFNCNSPPSWKGHRWEWRHRAPRWCTVRSQGTRSMPSRGDRRWASSILTSDQGSLHSSVLRPTDPSSGFAGLHVAALFSRTSE